MARRTRRRDRRDGPKTRRRSATRSGIGCGGSSAVIGTGGTNRTGATGRAIGTGSRAGTAETMAIAMIAVIMAIAATEMMAAASRRADYPPVLAIGSNGSAV